MSNESSVEILSHSSYERCPGLWHIVGEVENTGKDNVIGLEMTAHLYDEGGKVIGFGFGFASVKVLEPGQRSPFKIVVSEAGFKHYELRAKFGTTIQNPYRGLKILMDDSHLDEFGHYRVTGRVKNEGDQDVTSVRVTGTFYDSEGTVIATESVDGNPRDLGVGESGRFELVVSNERLSRRIHRYVLQVWSPHGLYIVSPKWG